MSQSAGVITVESLRKAYKDTVAVDDVSFSVDENEIFGIIGPNGSGKTTTVECLQGLRLPTSGSLRVLGLDPQRNGPQLRHRIGSQLQESALPERMKVWEALELFAATNAERRDWREAAREWGIFDRRNAAFANLSGGQRQRLFVALAQGAHAGALCPTGEAAATEGHAWYDAYSSEWLCCWGFSGSCRTASGIATGGLRWLAGG